jgi:hypothetical protein
MTNNEMMQVAETIRSQIHPTVLMCAAARNYGAIENEEGLYGIQFKISNTSKYKFATVRIILNGADLYDIEIKNVKGRIVEIKQNLLRSIKQYFREYVGKERNFKKLDKKEVMFA